MIAFNIVSINAQAQSSEADPFSIDEALKEQQTHEAGEAGSRLKTIPVFENGFALQYRFGRPLLTILNPEVDLNRPDLMYGVEMSLTERITRGDRVSTIHEAVIAELLLAARTYEESNIPAATPGSAFPQLRSSSSTDAAKTAQSDRSNNVVTSETHLDKELAKATPVYPVMDVLLYPANLKIRHHTRNRDDVWILDRTRGLLHKPAMGDSKVISFGDSYEGTSSLLASLSRPSYLRGRNGHLITYPQPSRFFRFVKLPWFDSAVASLLPPLLADTKMSEVGDQWEANVPIVCSLFADPAVILSTVQFYTFDEETGLAEIIFQGQTASHVLRPKPGIHHIRDGALARLQFSGRLYIHAATGWVQQSEMSLTCAIINREKQDLSASFEMKTSIKALATPAAIQQEWDRRKQGPGVQLVNAESEDVSQDEEFIPIGGRP